MRGPALGPRPASIKCWGYNEWDQLGYSSKTFTETDLPKPLEGVTNATMLALGSEHTCALLSTGGIECWGAVGIGLPENGGDEEKDYSPTPTAVSGITNATTVNSKGYTTCARLSTGSIDCWGDDEFGQLGDGKTTEPFEGSLTPVAVSGITNATAVSAGGASTCALLSGGGVDCWGDNEEGLLGNGTTTNSSTPVPVSGFG